MNIFVYLFTYCWFLSVQTNMWTRSAGASLRRYNEAALVEDIQTLFASWADSVNSCHRIFLRAPSYNKKVFFGGKNPLLDLKDERIVTIPFATRRPTFKEIRRVHELLASVECYGECNQSIQQTETVLKYTFGFWNCLVVLILYKSSCVHL